MHGDCTDAKLNITKAQGFTGLKNMNHILCTTSSFGTSAPGVLEKLVNNNFKPVLNPFKRKLSADELKSLVIEYQPMGLLAGTEPVTHDVLESGKNCLKVVSRVGVGWDNVDKPAAARLGIQVFRTEGVLNDAVAELCLGLVLSALRKVTLHDRQLRSGIWQKHMGGLLKGKIFGILGFGSIGRRVGELCHAFGAHILYHDPVSKEVAWAEPVEKQVLISASHIISIHADGASALMGQTELDCCRQGVILINTARGGMIEEDALARALLSGRVGCACLDVFDQEPYAGSLAESDRVILTPHIGSYAVEARVAMEEMAVDNLLKGLCVMDSNF